MPRSRAVVPLLSVALPFSLLRCAFFTPLPHCDVNRVRVHCAMATGEAEISFLGQAAAISVDEDLMSEEGGFSIDQLMELAGLSCACALSKEYLLPQAARVLVVCGPGNNGGDGLVMARHLHHFGYRVTVVYPHIAKRKTKDLYRRLVIQLEQLGLAVAEDFPDVTDFHVAVDAIFGFSFKGWRGGGKDAPFDTILERLTVSPVPVVSIDIPSGWDVETGPREGDLQPEMLVSLTAPKQCAKFFRGKHHYLGGRFVPPQIVDKHSLCLPAYVGAEQCVRIPCSNI